MSFIKKLGEQVGGGIIGMGMGMLDEAIMGNSRRRKQVEQQKKLTDINVAAQKDLMSLAQEQQLQMWKDTSYSAQMEQLANAGLNPALMYSGAGAGVTGTVGGGSVGTGQAADESQQKTAEMQAQAMGLQMAKTSAEIEVLKSQAEKNRADADLSGSQTTTEEKKRDIFIENLRQQGMGDWLINLRMQMENKGQMQDDEIQMFRNQTYDESTAFQKTGIWNQRETTAIAEAMARAGNQEAQALLNNEEAQVVWAKLINAEKIGDAVVMQAEAYKLANMWSTGEFTNWKTWVDLGKDAVGLVFDGIKAVKSPPGTNIESMTKNINLPPK